MTNDLVVLLNGREAGRVHSGAQGRLTFIYDDKWREADDAYPLSLSMPLAAKEHGPFQSSRPSCGGSCPTMIASSIVGLPSFKYLPATSLP